ncbi:MAG: glycosyltransferase family 9 protein [Trebonia sp.]
MTLSDHSPSGRPLSSRPWSGRLLFGSDKNCRPHRHRRGHRPHTGEQPIALLLRGYSLADFLTGLPALRMLRDALPEHRLVLAAPAEFAPLARRAGPIDELCPMDRLRVRAPPPQRPDLAVDLHGNGLASRALLRSTQPTRLVAFGRNAPRWRAGEHEVARWCRLVAEGLPARAANYPGLLGVLPPSRDPVPGGVTILHCSADSPARCWPAQRFAALAILLRERGHDVVITADHGDAGRARAIAAASHTRAAPLLPLRALCALAQRARAVISTDTGVAHLASVYATPSVVLFGPMSPRQFGPPHDPRHEVLWHGEDLRDPINDVTAGNDAAELPQLAEEAGGAAAGGDRQDRPAGEPCPALSAISVHEVSAAVNRALSAHQPHPGLLTLLDA